MILTTVNISTMLTPLIRTRKKIDYKISLNQKKRIIKVMGDKNLNHAKQNHLNL